MNFSLSTTRILETVRAMAALYTLSRGAADGDSEALLLLPVNDDCRRPLLMETMRTAFVDVVAGLSCFVADYDCKADSLDLSIALPRGFSVDSHFRLTDMLSQAVAMKTLASILVLAGSDSVYVDSYSALAATALAGAVDLLRGGSDDLAIKPFY